MYLLIVIKMFFFCSIQKHDFLEAETSTSDSDMKDVDLESNFYNVSNQFPV